MKTNINKLWDDLDYPEKLRKHCLVVNKKALEISDALIADGIKVDRELVNAGSLLHDIGRGEKHSIKRSYMIIYIHL